MYALVPGLALQQRRPDHGGGHDAEKDHNGDPERATVFQEPGYLHSDNPNEQSNILPCE
jgi:hypothetical protein